MQWYLAVFRKYAEFSGRSRRKEYWFFVLFNIVIAFALAFIDAMVGLFNEEVGIGVLSGLYLLVILIPGIAVAIRRLHDTGRSGWWFLLNLIPILGPLVFLVFMVLDSESGTNQYGPNPKEHEMGAGMHATPSMSRP